MMSIGAPQCRHTKVGRGAECARPSPGQREAWRGLMQKSASGGNVALTVGAGEQPIVADAVKAGGRTCSRKRRMNSSVVKVITLWRVRPLAVVLPAERDAVFIEGHEA